MEPALFFDAFTRVGPRPRKHLAHAWKLTELIAEMEHCSISGALVAHTQSVAYDAMHGNRELCALLAGYKHLFPIWNVLPHYDQEFPKPPELARLMRAHGVRAVTIHPKTNAWDLEAEHNQGLLRALAQRRVPTFIDRAELVDYAQLDRLLLRHRRLPVILSGASWSEQRLLLPLMTQRDNLHLIFDVFQVHYGIEHLVAAGCEDRLLYGSNAPLMSMGAHRTYIDYAEVPAKTRAKIAGGNLSRLLGGHEPPSERHNHGEDALMSAVRHGLPLPVPVRDMHMHILHEGLHGGGGAFRMERGGPRGVFHQLKRLGVVGGGFMSWNGVVGCDSLGGNETVTQTLDAAPPGYWGLASFDPSHYSQAELSSLIPSVYADRRFIGMKPYFLYGVEYHHPSYDVWWRFGAKHRLYALIHRTRSDFKEVDILARRFPRVRWVVAHCGADHATADLAIASIKQYPNVYAEITLTPVTFGIIDYLVEHAGADRIVYGSDLPMRDPRQQLGWVVFSRLSLAAKKRVLSGNASAIIAPCAARLTSTVRGKAGR